jgi:hypothetical protein
LFGQLPTGGSDVLVEVKAEFLERRLKPVPRRAREDDAVAANKSTLANRDASVWARRDRKMWCKEGVGRIARRWEWLGYVYRLSIVRELLHGI